jgi:Glyoxalase/Bleomycin resistance protein/Dioxygenase superfamily
MSKQIPVLFHTGMAVHDLDNAMADMSSAFGYHWAEPFVSERRLRCPDGIRSRTWRLTYSIEGPHHVELFQQIDDTALRGLTGGPTVHHLGFEVSDVAEEVARLAAIGFQEELTDTGVDGAEGGNSFVYNHHGGLWFELISSARRARLDEWIAGGPPPNAAK